MNFDLPTPERHISETEWESVFEECSVILEKIKAKPGPVSSSFEHITNNWLSTLNFKEYSKDIPDMRSPKMYDAIVSTVKKAKKYLALLEEFPDFAAKELSEGRGCFPEIYDETPDTERLIDGYEARLRQ